MTDQFPSDREKDDELEYAHEVLKSVSGKSPKAPIYFAGATAIAVGLFFGLPNWVDSDDTTSAEVVAPEIDEPEAETDFDDDPDEVDEPLPGLENDDDDPQPTASNTPEPLVTPLPSVSVWQMLDELGDWEEWGGLEPIQSERTAEGRNAGEIKTAADLASLAVSSSDNSTTVAVGFAGDAQGVEEFERADLSGSVGIILPDGTRVEVIFTDDGSVKIPSAQPGVSAARKWQTPQELVLTLNGVSVEAGAMIGATLILSVFDGTEIDTLQLDTSQ